MSSDASELGSAWNAAINQINDESTKALGFGKRFRINVCKALKACFLTAKAILKGKIAIATAKIDPLSIMELGAEAFAAAVAVLDAIREKMSPIDYLICLALSARDDGLTKEELCTEVNDLLRMLTPTGESDAAEQPTLPFYLSIRKADVDLAKNDWGDGSKVDDILAELLRSRTVDRVGPSKYTYHDRDFEWGFS